MTKSKIPDIQAVLQKARESLKTIEQEYQKALRERELPSRLLVEIKDFLQNLRSALDYLAPKVGLVKGYFPIANSPADFQNKSQGTPPAVAAVLLRWQPFNGNDWLRWFNNLNNKLKHVALIAQTRTETPRSKVSGSTGSVSWGPGVTFGPGVKMMGVQVNPATQLPIPSHLTITKEIWVDFTFDNSIATELPPSLSALPFLRDCHAKVRQIVAEVEAAAML